MGLKEELCQVRVRSRLVALGLWVGVEKTLEGDNQEWGVERRAISSLSFPDDSCLHHFPSLIPGLRAITEPFLLSLLETDAN